MNLVTDEDFGELVYRQNQISADEFADDQQVVLMFL